MSSWDLPSNTFNSSKNKQGEAKKVIYPIYTEGFIGPPNWENWEETSNDFHNQ